MVESLGHQHIQWVWTKSLKTNADRWREGHLMNFCRTLKVPLRKPKWMHACLEKWQQGVVKMYHLAKGQLVRWKKVSEVIISTYWFVLRVCFVRSVGVTSLGFANWPFSFHFKEQFACCFTAHNYNSQFAGKLICSYIAIWWTGSNPWHWTDLIVLHVRWAWSVKVFRLR